MRLASGTVEPEESLAVARPEYVGKEPITIEAGDSTPLAPPRHPRDNKILVAETF